MKILDRIFSEITVRVNDIMEIVLGIVTLIKVIPGVMLMGLFLFFWFAAPIIVGILIVLCILKFLAG